MTQPMMLLKKIATALTEHHWQLVTAESCTGGLVSSLITEIPGSSSWFERGFVTYSNLAKQEMLGVSPQLIEEYGAVSEEVASAMATGALQHSAGDIAIAITGIAGPDGGSVEKPVGTVCLGWALRHSPAQTLKKHYTGTRKEIRSTACFEALEGVLLLIQKIHSIRD